MQWLFGATSYGNIVDGILLYNFAAELGMSYHQKSRENLASNWAVRRLNQVLAMVQCSVEDQTASAKRSRRRWPVAVDRSRATIRASGTTDKLDRVKIRGRIELRLRPPHCTPAHRRVDGLVADKPPSSCTTCLSTRHLRGDSLAACPTITGITATVRATFFPRTELTGR
jgi:hypothetical protein